MSVTTGMRSHSINRISGVTSISPPSVRPARLKSSLGRRWYPYIWRQGFLTVTGVVLGLVHSKKNPTRASPTYATSPLAQKSCIFARQLEDLYHLLPLSNTFHCPARNTCPEKYPSLTLFSLVPPRGSPVSSSAIATSVGSHRS